MSRPTRTTADVISAASEPCHHRREPFGPCAICLEDEIDRETGGADSWYESEMAELKGYHAAELAERDDHQTETEGERDAALDAIRKLVKEVRGISSIIHDAETDDIEQQLDAAAETAETAI